MKSIPQALFLLIALMSLPATADAQTLVEDSPQVITQLEHTIGTTTEVALLLSTHNVALNVYEATLLFKPGDVAVTSVEVESALCESQFVIEKTVNYELGKVYVACGTTTPFTSSTTTTPVLRVIYEKLGDVQLAPFTLGEQTNFYIHDGLGTLATRQPV